MLPLVATLLIEASAHGRLKDPPARSDSNVAVNDRPMKEFACRSGKNPGVPATEVEAGEQLTLTFDLDAKHPGDVAVYMSYDHDMPYETIDEMRFFKIANIFDAQNHDNQPVSITLPDWLPGGNAVLRWEWYALHENPNVEFWTQCSDLVVKPTAKELPVEKVPAYRVVIGDNARTLPLEGPRRENSNELKKYRRVVYSRKSFKWENPDKFMTGPECALGFSKNDCSMTAHGTKGHIDVWHKHQEDDPDAFAEFQRPTLPTLSPAVKAGILSVIAVFILYCCCPWSKCRNQARKKAKTSYQELPQLDNVASESQRFFNMDHDTVRERLNSPRSCRTPVLTRRRSSIRRRSVQGSLPGLANEASIGRRGLPGMANEASFGRHLSAALSGGSGSTPRSPIFSIN